MTVADERLTFHAYEPYLSRVTELSVFRELYGGNRIILGIRNAFDGSDVRPELFVVMWCEDTGGRARKFAGVTVRPDLERVSDQESTAVFLLRKGWSKKLGDRALIPAGSRSIRRHSPQLVRHRPAVADDEVFPGQAVPFHAVGPGLPGHTMSTDVYHEFWNALGDQEELIYAVVEIEESAQ
ncbi:hypothetical protein M1L60_46190 [Actinoplanes sp. TRM 88003]|uniref:Uncharacterized protein n=1 Tax=Paractinoplanes aksuensis TaxID=2939490 RepID=A0ABT1E4F7_9ACTN|nr:hypothetical protein [Actinoplanes aksuensis]MCO8277988.1 hypothetical protein [Actinoplanes aksuensis]